MRETMETNVFQALIKRDPRFLEKRLDELLPMRFMGEVAVNAYRSLIKRLDDLPLAQEEKASKLKDGQDAGRALLMIEARIGELLPKDARIPLGRKQSHVPNKDKAGIKALPDGIDRRRAHHARTIAAHPEAVAEVIKEAEKNEDIPTKTAVLNKIAHKRELERKKGEREKTQIEMAADAYLYFSKLEDALRLIPTTPPKNLRQQDFIKIKAVAILIIKRLLFFTTDKIRMLMRVYYGRDEKGGSR